MEFITVKEHLHILMVQNMLGYLRMDLDMDKEHLQLLMVQNITVNTRMVYLSTKKEQF